MIKQLNLALLSIGALAPKGVISYNTTAYLYKNLAEQYQEQVTINGNTITRVAQYNNITLNEWQDLNGTIKARTTQIQLTQFGGNSIDGYYVTCNLYIGVSCLSNGWTYNATITPTNSLDFNYSSITTMSYEQETYEDSSSYEGGDLTAIFNERFTTVSRITEQANDAYDYFDAHKTNEIEIYLRRDQLGDLTFEDQVEFTYNRYRNETFWAGEGGQNQNKNATTYQRIGFSFEVDVPYDEMNINTRNYYLHFFDTWQSKIQYQIEYEQRDVNITGEVIDIPGLIFSILGMPFAWISTAFNLTLFPGTPYSINIANVILGIIGMLIAVFIIKKLIK